MYGIVCLFVTVCLFVYLLVYLFTSLFICLLYVCRVELGAYLLAICVTIPNIPIP